MQVTLQTRFTASFDTLTGGFANTDDRIGIAVSGGPDSMALLALARQSWPGRVHAATVDHQLRADSAAEADMVAQYCAVQDIAHNVLAPRTPITGNIQSAARKVRYALLRDWAADAGCQWIATAHHGDDQLETLLLRLTRGAGLDGLSGIRARTGNIVRPLLDMRKSDLLAYCRDNAVPFISDPSNADRDFDRVRMRQALATLDMLNAPQANRSAAALADAGTALDWVVAREAARHVRDRGDTVTLAETAYPREILRRLVLHCLRRVDPAIEPRGAALIRLLEALQRGDKAMIGNIMCTGGALWTFAPAPPRQA